MILTKAHESKILNSVDIDPQINKGDNWSPFSSSESLILTWKSVGNRILLNFMRFGVMSISYVSGPREFGAMRFGALGIGATCVGAMRFGATRINHQLLYLTKISILLLEVGNEPNGSKQCFSAYSINYNFQGWRLHLSTTFFLKSCGSASIFQSNAVKFEIFLKKIDNFAWILTKFSNDELEIWACNFYILILSFLNLIQIYLISSWTKRNDGRSHRQGRNR